MPRSCSITYAITHHRKAHCCEPALRHFSHLLLSLRLAHHGDPFFIKPKSLARELTEEGRYVLAGSYQDFDFYLAAHVKCPAIGKH